MQVANRVCNGRVVSVLEGGYRVQGQIVSAFARSVAAHVHSLAEPNEEVWADETAAAERNAEARERERKIEMKEKRAAARMESEAMLLRQESGLERQADSLAGLGSGAFDGLPQACGDMDMAVLAAAAGVESAGAGGAAAQAAAAGAAAAFSVMGAEKEQPGADGDAGGAGGGPMEAVVAAVGWEGVQLATGAAAATAVAMVEGADAGMVAASTGDVAVAGDAAAGEGGGRSKRRRGAAPDYVSLNRELEQEKAGTQEGAGAVGEKPGGDAGGGDGGA